MEGKRSERELEIKRQQDTSESGDLPAPQDATHTERLPDVPLTFEEQQRRFGGTDAAAHAQLAAEDQGTPLPEGKLARQFGRDAESAADRQLERWDENHLEVAAAELRQIKCLDPARWKNADRHDRELTLIEANRVLGGAYNWGAVTLEFKKMDDLGQAAPDGSHIWLNEKFLGSDDPAFAQYEHPSWALGTVCHEYRHFFQEENVHAMHGSIRPDVPESVAEHWEKDRANYVPGGDLDQDSDDLADRLCRRVYGQASQYR